ncbi:MAG TPA: RHS repeat-associated core domain-containing protein [Acidobacteriota bacterium]
MLFPAVATAQTGATVQPGDLFFANVNSISRLPFRSTSGIAETFLSRPDVGRINAVVVDNNLTVYYAYRLTVPDPNSADAKTSFIARVNSAGSSEIVARVPLPTASWSLSEMTAGPTGNLYLCYSGAGNNSAVMLRSDRQIIDMTTGRPLQSFVGESNPTASGFFEITFAVNSKDQLYGSFRPISGSGASTIYRIPVGSPSQNLGTVQNLIQIAFGPSDGLLGTVRIDSQNVRLVRITVPAAKHPSPPIEYADLGVVPLGDVPSTGGLEQLGKVVYLLGTGKILVLASEEDGVPTLVEQPCISCTGSGGSAKSAKEVAGAPIAESIAPPPTVTPTAGTVYSLGIGGDGNGKPFDGEPVVTSTGEFVHSELDLGLGGPMPLVFTRYYGGLLGASAESSSFYAAADSPMGGNWVHNFLILLRRIDANNVTVHYYEGKTIFFKKSASAWTMAQPGVAYKGTPYQLVESGTKLKMMDPDSHVIFSFDTSGMAEGGVRGVEAISDRNSNTHTLSYNSDGTLAKVADGLGRSLDFTYTSSGGKLRISKIADQTGRSIQFTYSGAQLATYTDARAKTTTYGTNANSLIESIRKPAGNTPVRNTYNTGSAKVLTQADGLGAGTRFTYNADNTAITDALGNSRTHFFNNELRFVKFTDEAGKAIQFGYDNSQRKTSTTDRFGDSSASTYDAASGKVSSMTDYTGKAWRFSYASQAQDGFTFFELARIDYPDVPSTKISFALTRDEFTYDAKGNLVSRTDRAGKVWTYTHNERGQILTATNPENGVTTYAYNSDATVASVRDPAGNGTSFGYDSLKRRDRITRADGTTVRFAYDANDNLTNSVNEKGKTTAYGYDDNNNLKNVTNRLGKIWTLNYDANENITAVTDPLGKTTTYAYDALRRLKSVVDRNGNQVTYNYDARGRLTSVVDAAGKTWAYTYDDENFLTASTNPLGQVWRYTNDKQGRPTTLSDPLSNQTRFEYNALSRVVSATNPLSETRTYGYETRGLLSQISDPGPITAAYTRDNLGLVRQTTNPRGKVWNRGYDNLGRLISSTDPLGNLSRLTYDPQNRLTRVDLPLGVLNLTRDESGLITAENYSDGTRLDYNYDDNDRLISASGVALSYDDDDRIVVTNGMTLSRDNGGRITTMTLAPGKAVSYAYDARNLLTSVTDWAGGTTRFSYDDARRPVTLSRPNGIVTSYSYDAAGRLTGIVEGRGQTYLSSIALTKDSAGRTRQAVRSVPAAPVVGRENPSRNYNDADQVVGFDYDALGRLTNDGARTYLWDLASRLASYNDGQSTVNLTYDAFGHRLTRAVRTAGNDGTTRSYTWSYALALPSISIVKDDGNTIRYYVHTPGGALLYSIEESGSARRFYHYDEIGSTLFLTDDNGTVTDSYAYSAYGQITASNGSTDNPFAYVGKYGVMREPTDLYYMRARYYDSSTGRFLIRDPRGQDASDPASINRYQYVAQNPTRNVDPMGLDATENDFDASDNREFMRFLIKYIEKQEEERQRKRREREREREEAGRIHRMTDAERNDALIAAGLPPGPTAVTMVADPSFYMKEDIVLLVEDSKPWQALLGQPIEPGDAAYDFIIEADQAGQMLGGESIGRARKLIQIFRSVPLPPEAGDAQYDFVIEADQPGQTLGGEWIGPRMSRRP